MFSGPNRMIYSDIRLFLFFQAECSAVKTQRFDDILRSIIKLYRVSSRLLFRSVMNMEFSLNTVADLNSLKIHTFFKCCIFYMACLIKGLF